MGSLKGVILRRSTGLKRNTVAVENPLKRIPIALEKGTPVKRIPFALEKGTPLKRIPFDVERGSPLR